MVSRSFYPLFIILSLFAVSLPTQAASLDEVKQAIAEAESLRAAEFAPAHFNAAKQALNQAQELLIQRAGNSKVRGLLDQAAGQAAAASRASQDFTQNFSNLVESRDRLQLAGDKYMRDDLAERSEKEFAVVVEAAEKGNLKKARKEAVNARRTFNAAQVVAAREQFVRPIAKSISEARKNKGREFAPKAYNEASAMQKKVEALVSSNPDAQTQAYALYQQGFKSAQHASRVANLGTQINKKPQLLESWVDANDARMAILAKALGIQLDRSQSPEVQLSMLKQAIEDMQSEYQAQVADADKQVRELSTKLAKYEGELSDMAEVRRKLQLKREAEAKIQRLTKLFNPDDVEILLTPDADVIFRMKTLNFRSGSAVIPTQTYGLLDNAIKSIEIFPKRSVRIEGHTDFMGGNKYNQALSERRANAVKEYLQQNMGEFSNTLDAVGHGEEKPIANNETAAGRTKNRRIDIILVAPPAMEDEGN